MILETTVIEFRCQTLELRALEDQVCTKAETRELHERLIFKRDMKCLAYHRAPPDSQRKPNRIYEVTSFRNPFQNTSMNKSI